VQIDAEDALQLAEELQMLVDGQVVEQDLADERKRGEESEPEFHRQIRAFSIEMSLETYIVLRADTHEGANLIHLLRHVATEHRRGTARHLDHTVQHADRRGFTGRREEESNN
jgi:hypothetical protein